MASVLRYLPGSASSDLSSGGLDGLTANTGGTSDVFDNASSGARWTEGTLRLTIDFGSAPTAGGAIDVYMMCALDGTNYPTTETPNVPNGLASMRVGTYTVEADTDVQRLDLPIKLLPYNTKFHLVNRTSQTFPSTTGILLHLYPHTTEVTAA